MHFFYWNHKNEDIFIKYEDYPRQKMKNNQFRPFHGSENKHSPDFCEISENQRFFFIYGSSRCQKIGSILSKLGILCWIVSVCKYISRKYQKLGFLRRLDLAKFPVWAHCVHSGPRIVIFGNYSVSWEIIGIEIFPRASFSYNDKYEKMTKSNLLPIMGDWDQKYESRDFCPCSV